MTVYIHVVLHWSLLSVTRRQPQVTEVTCWYRSGWQSTVVITACNGDWRAAGEPADMLQTERRWRRLPATAATNRRRTCGWSIDRSSSITKDQSRLIDHRERRQPSAIHLRPRSIPKCRRINDSTCGVHKLGLRGGERMEIGVAGSIPTRD